MRKIIFTLICISAFAANISAQSKAIGARLSSDTIEASYLIDPLSDVFYEANLGLDTGHKDLGFKGEFMMNIVIARPKITKQGVWSIYPGVGLAGGYVYGESLSTFIYRDPWQGTKHRVNDRWGTGPMLGIALQAGMSYTFDFPLRISVDFRPIIGLHKAERIHPDSDSTRYIGMYGDGLLESYIPKVSVHYLF